MMTMTTKKWKTWSELENVKGTNKQKDMSEMLPEWAEMLAFFQVYPDLFIDYVLPKDSTFKLYPFQRVYLRIMARYRKVYITATRGTSKSFLNILSMYLKCIFFPNIKLSLSAPQKEQSASISQENIKAIWNFMPILKNEIKKETFAKDFTRLTFKNESVLDIVVVSQGSRGLRRHGLSFEEICQMERHRETIGEVLLPLLANNRKGADGHVSPHEIHKQLMYVTTASSRQSYAWEQLMNVMMEMAMGKSAFVIGNDYSLPVMFDQLDEGYIDEVRNDPSINPLQFAREYNSIWTGSSDNSLVQLKDLEKCRVLDKPESERPERGAKNADYIIAVDVARSSNQQNATTAIAVFKIIDRGNGQYWKWLVHLETYNKDMHFDTQGLYLKEMVNRFDAKMLVIDGNGVGAPLVDVLVKEDKYPSYSVVNDAEGEYDGYKLPNSMPVLYNLKSSRKETKASDIHNNFMTVIKNHDLKILVDEQEIRESKKYRSIKENDYVEQVKMLKPFVETTRFVDEVMNLKYEELAGGTTVKKVSNKMDKDRYSAVSYGLFYIKLLEKENQKKKRETVDATGFLAIKQAKYKPRGWR